MIQKVLKSLTIILLLLVSENIGATHLMGGEITWDCAGNGTYIFSMKLYRDCNGVGFANTVVNMAVHNHPTLTNIVLNKTADNDISPQCTGTGPSTTCVGGGNGAVQELIFTSAPTTLSGTPPAQGWVFTYSNCCRNIAIENLIGPQTRGFTLRAKMFASASKNTNPCYDSSPSFSTKPTTLVCTSVPFTYNHLAFDRDGDSLVYSWAKPLDRFSGAFTASNPSAIPFSGTYSFNSPYPNTSHHPSNVPATIDPNSGEITFTSFTQGSFVNCVKVSSYKCGELVAEIYREIQVIVLPCAANSKPTTSPPFLNSSGNSSFSDTVIAGDLINFKYCGYDTPGQIMNMTVIGDQFGTNYANPNAGCQNPPCAILGPPPLPSISGTDSVCVYFQWQTSCDHLQSTGDCAVTSSTYQFLFTIQDDACPTAGLNISTVSITVVSPRPIESPKIHCVSVIPNGDVVLTWETPIDTTSGFNGYEIFHSSNPSGPFSSLALVNNYNQTNYTHSGANGNAASQYYYIQSLGCSRATISTPSDTASSIHLTALGSGNIVNLNWNSINNSLASSSSTWYQIYREQPIGTWSFVDSVQALTYIDTVFFCDSILSYRVEIEDDLPCTSLSSLDTTSVSNNTLSFSDFSFTGNCIGDTTQFTFINNSGVTILNYHWKFGDGDTSNTSNPIHYYNSSGSYSVSLNSSTAFGCIDSITKTIRINDLPFSNAGSDNTICAGESITIGGNTTGPVNSSYTWSPAATLSNDTISNPLSTPTSSSAEYIVTVTDTNGCFNIDSVIVNLNPLPIINPGSDQTICIGDSISIGGSPTGPEGSTYLWSHNSPLNSDTSANPFAMPINPSSYLVTVTDTNGCVDTASTKIDIDTLPIINAGPDLWLCKGDSILLNASGGLSYLWSPSQSLNDTVVSTPTAFPLNSTNYFVKGFDVNGCANVDTVLLLVNNEVPINSGKDTSICQGDSVQLGGFPTSPIGTTYSWFPNTDLNDDTLANPTAFPNKTTTYYVTATNDTCSSIDSVTITVMQRPIANLGANIDICVGDSTQLNASEGNAFLWNPKNTLTDSSIFNPVAFPIDTTKYILLITDTNGCSAFDSIIVNVNSLPVISITTSPSYICLKDSLELTATGANSYLWNPGISITDSTIPNPVAFPISDTKYIVSGTDINGCLNFDTVAVFINNLTITDLSDTAMCIGDSVQLLVSGPSGASYLWSPNTNLSNATIFNPFTYSKITTKYIVTVTDLNNCKDSTSVNIIVQPKPTAKFTQISTPICDGISVQFSNSSIESASYLWLFGDGEQSIEINPTYVFSYANSYTTLITAYGTGGCSDTASLTFNTKNFESYFNPKTPSILTPNGDGLNDIFKIDLPVEINNCTGIKIFNRWGLNIYDSYGENNGWGGKTNTGEEAAAGTYFYIVDINGLIKKGSITLMR